MKGLNFWKNLLILAFYNIKLNDKDGLDRQIDNYSLPSEVEMRL